MEQVHARQYGMIWTFYPLSPSNSFDGTIFHIFNFSDLRIIGKNGVGNYITDSEQAAGVQTLPNLRCKNFRYVDFKHLVMRKWFVHLAHPQN